MGSLQPTLSSGTLVNIHFILLGSAPKQICLSHGTYMSHSTNIVVYI